ncbi:MAG: hypothetical protein EBV62_12260 [Betaproteobacteria bacterium]|nr:hypothetical protein [Betaproteobacteria bacterium]
MQPGENSLVVTVTAADGETTQVYTVTLNVALGNNTELAVFTVNGSDVADGDVVDLAPYTTEVEVVAEASDPDATVVIEGGTDLQPGENSLTVVVTAADGETTAEYNVTLNVALGNNTDLAVFTVNGSDVADGDSVDLEPGTSEVESHIVFSSSLTISSSNNNSQTVLTRLQVSTTSDLNSGIRIRSLSNNLNLSSVWS